MAKHFVSYPVTVNLVVEVEAPLGATASQIEALVTMDDIVEAEVDEIEFVTVGTNPNVILVWWEDYKHAWKYGDYTVHPATEDGWADWSQEV